MSSEDIKTLWEDDDVSLTRREPVSIEPRHKLQLEFRCDKTAPNHRRVCQSFWQLIDQQPELDHIMAKGWSVNDEVPKNKQKGTSSRDSREPQPCEELRKFIIRHADVPALVGVKSDTSVCRPHTYEESLAQLYSDLHEFNSTVVPQSTIPPKIPRRPHVTHSKD